MKIISQRSVCSALALSLLLIFGNASAQEAHVYLRAQQFNKNIPAEGGNTQVRMWGYRLCTTDFASCPGPTLSPGPAISMDPADTSLVIHLRNALPGGLTNVTNETSVIVPSLPKALSPVTFTDDQGRARISSFDEVTPRTGNAANRTRIYRWDNVPAGTYLYHSGTHPQVQVQMGLFGVVTKNEAAGEAYPGVSFDQEATLVFSEIDPAIHDAIASDTYGTTSGPTSTENYQPRFFLLNGSSFDSGDAPIVSADSGDNILLRLVNGGIENHSPQLIGGYVDLIAEDGHRAPVDRSQHTVLLAAGKTRDVLFQPDGGGVYSLIDRRLRTVNDTLAGGGMFARIAVNGVSGGASTYFSTVGGGNGNPVPLVGAPYDDADIYSWNGAALFAREWDASDNGMPGNADVDGLTWTGPGQFLASFANNAGTATPGLGIVQDEDVVAYDNGVWTPYFDGSAACGLDSVNGQDLDAISVTGGVLYFSTVGGSPVAGAAAPYDDADIYSWDGVSCARVFDASANGLPGNADINGLTIIDETQFYATFVRSAGTEVPGLGTVQDEDVVYFDDGTWTMYFDGSTYGLDASNGQNVDALDVQSP